jgi:hypothetical protein
MRNKPRTVVATTVTLDDMRNHVDQLVLQLQAERSPDDAVTICWIEDHDEAQVLKIYGEVLEIHLPIIKSKFDYAGALHEFGHVNGSHQRSNNSAVRERWAWRWARGNALVWTVEMDRYARQCLATTGALKGWETVR